MNGKDFFTRTLNEQLAPGHSDSKDCAESLTEAMRRVTEEAKEEIAKAVREADERAA